MRKRWIASIGFIALVASVTFYGATDIGKDVEVTRVQSVGTESVAFLSAMDGSAYLTANTPFEIYNDQMDLSLRLSLDLHNRSRAENIAALRRLVSEQPTDWHEGQIRDHLSLLQQAKSRVDGIGSCIWPEELAMIKSQGNAQFGAYYTTGSAIVTPSSQMKFLFVPPRRTEVELTLAHEIWHVASRNDRDLRSRAYSVFGFERIKDIVIPPAIKARIIANPDVEDLGYSITLDKDNERQRFVVILQSKLEKYEGRQGVLGLINPLAGYMETMIYPISDNGMIINRPELLTDQLDAKIGTISSYRLGPDEIVASAFEALLAREAGEADYPQTSQNETLLDDLSSALSCKAE